MKILVFGKGLLGGAFDVESQSRRAILGRHQEVKFNADIEVVGRDRCDITDIVAVGREVEAFKPDAIVNAAAYTDVDGAQTHVGDAMSVNAIGAGGVAQVAKIFGARLVHVSTDYVFGDGFTAPIPASAKPEPLGIYGRSKLYGEGLVRALNGEAIIVRTASTYSVNHAVSGAMMWLARLPADFGEVGVLDQVISPTAVEDLKIAILHLCRGGEPGMHHYAGPPVRRVEAAEAILEMIGRRDVKVTPMWPGERLPARRPQYSAIETSPRLAEQVPPRSWREGYASALREKRGT